MNNSTLQSLCLIGARKLAIYEIYARLCGAHDRRTFYDNLSKYAELLSQASGLPADFYMCAWFRLYSYYARNRTALVNGGFVNGD